MILAVMLIGLLIVYLSIGLAVGRTFFIIKLKQWHNTYGVTYKTQRQIEQERKLEELEDKQSLETRIEEANNARIRLVTRRDAAESAVDDLMEEKLTLETSIMTRGRDSYVIIVDQVMDADPVKLYSDGSTTLGREFDLICSKLETARVRLRSAERDLEVHEKCRNKNNYYSPSRWEHKQRNTYEEYLANKKKDLNPLVISMVFLWPLLGSWFVGRFTVNHAIKFGDKILHADKLDKYVAPDEYKLEAKIKALTEKDPELSKMYSDLVKSLEA